MAGTARDADALLADIDSLLSEVPAQETAPAPDLTAAPAPEPAPAPAATRGDTWEEVTAPRRESDRNRTIRRGGWQPRDLPETLQPKPSPAPTPATGPEPEPSATPEDEPKPRTAAPVAEREEALDKLDRLLSLLTPPDAPPAGSSGVEPTSNGDSDGDSPDPADAPLAPAPSPARVIATAVGEWRLPPRLGGRRWLDVLGYNALAIIAGLLVGFTQGAYITLDTMSVNPDALAGITISAAIAALMVRPTWKTFASLGAALVIVFIVQLLSLTVCAGLLAVLVTWGLDQRARTIRQPVALVARALFLAMTLALCALTWTTVVPALTGATQ
ncbi:hypothetical protein [Streptomyces sp. NPDC052179]|uniref:hypothetical protein n=1 Tax=Streptomyces sp. NPDC052179 TaxID=3155680 RepID=UPI003446FE38